MARYIISPGQKIEASPNLPSLKVSELFCDTFQGEGAYAGVPSIFLRLSGCPLNCCWCDSKEIWKKSTNVNLVTLMSMFSAEGLIDKLNSGHHLVITGGSPLLQQDNLQRFLYELIQACRIKPFVEIENEVSVLVSPQNNSLFYLIDCWNNSIKLASSKVPLEKRRNFQAVEQLQKQASECWFKFVVDSDKCWSEIEIFYLKTGLVRRSQIILMPEGANRQQLTVEKKVAVAELAISENVRYGSRLQIDLYDDKKGV